MRKRRRALDSSGDNGDGLGADVGRRGTGLFRLCNEGISQSRAGAPLGGARHGIAKEGLLLLSGKNALKVAKSAAFVSSNT